MASRRTVVSLVFVLIGFAALTYMRQNGVYPFGGTKGPGTPRVRLGTETTHIVRPLRKDAYVDYMRALNDAAREGVTRENNAVVLVWQAWGPNDLAKPQRTAYYDMLDMATPAARGAYFIPIEQHVVHAAGRKALTNQRSLQQALKIVTHQRAIQQTLAALQRAVGTAVGHAWRQEDYPDLHAWLSRNKKPLDRLVDAGARSRWFDPLVCAPDSHLLMQAQRPALRPIRDMTRALCVRATLAVGNGNLDAAIRDLSTCRRLARLVGQGPMFLDAVTACSIEQMVCRADAALLAASQLNGTQARAMLAELVHVPPLPATKALFDRGERFSYLDAICVMARAGPDAFEQLADDSNDRQGSTIRRAISSWGLASLDWNLMLTMANRCYDESVDAACLPTRAERRAARTRIEDAFTADDSQSGLRRFFTQCFSPRATISKQVARFMLRLALPIQTAVADIVDRATMHSELIRIGFALAAYRADHGTYPQTLARLAPEYIEHIPMDIFAQRPLKYATTEVGYTLYSVGSNGKDDGGISAYDDPDSQTNTDIVLRVPCASRRSEPPAKG